jgi:hypothetical protein
MYRLNAEPLRLTKTPQSLNAAFPSRLCADVDIVARSLVAEHSTLYEPIGLIQLDGEPLYIPSRVYYAEHLSSRALSPTQWCIYSCIYTRHCDGFVRQKHVRSLLSRAEPWSAPFVVQLLGEYILEIVETITEASHFLEADHFRAFVQQNPAFIQLTLQRATSYWNCYYRRSFPKLEDYPAVRLLRSLR